MPAVVNVSAHGPEGLLERLGPAGPEIGVRLNGEGGDDAVYETDRFLGQSCGGKVAASAQGRWEGGLNLLRRFTNSVVRFGGPYNYCSAHDVLA